MILIVDDSKDMQALIRMALKDDGFEVRCAGNGAEALKFIDCEHLPRLIFLDSKMDVMDGSAFLNALERRCSSADVPVVVMSGTERPLASRLIVKSLLKPVDLDELRGFALKYAT